MQNKLSFLWALLLPALFALPSCGDELLTERPTNFLSPANFYRNLSDAEIALAGVYAGQMRVQGYAGGDAGVALLWGVHGSDEIVIPPWAPVGRRSLFLYNANPNIDIFFTVYSRHYQEINRANTAFDRITAMTEDQIDPEQKARILSEIRVIRANYYFNLVRLYNRVPLVTEERTDLNNLEFEQAPPEELYNFVTSEIMAAIPSLDRIEGNVTSKITVGAAQALLGKVYLQMAGWPLKQQDKFALAAEQFNNVIQSNDYELLADYQQVFDFENEGHREMVYLIEHDGPGQNIDGSQNSNLGSFMGPHGSLNEGAGWGTAWGSIPLENAYDRGDQRRKVNFAYGPAPNVLDSVNGPNQFKPWKWQKPNPNNWGNDTPFDYPYIRYAEVLLGYAEAHAQANGGVTPEALGAINKVRARARAGQGPNVVPDIEAGISLADFTAACLNERWLELCYEGHRRGDMIRTETLVERMTTLDFSGSAVYPGPPDPQDYERLWPIPQAVLDLNPRMMQNPGW